MFPVILSIHFKLHDERSLLVFFLCLHFVALTVCPSAHNTHKMLQTAFGEWVNPRAAWTNKQQPAVSIRDVPNWSRHFSDGSVSLLLYACLNLCLFVAIRQIIKLCEKTGSQQRCEWATRGARNINKHQPAVSINDVTAGVSKHFKQSSVENQWCSLNTFIQNMTGHYKKKYRKAVMQANCP